jgi:hypothetical protein
VSVLSLVSLGVGYLILVPLINFLYIPNIKAFKVTSSVRFDENTKRVDILAVIEPTDRYQLPTSPIKTVFELEGELDISEADNDDSDDTIAVNQPRRSRRERRSPNRLIGELEQ